MKLSMPIQQPQLGDKGSFELPRMKYAYNAALGHDNRDDAKSLRYRGSGDVPASEAQWEVDAFARGVEVAACCNHRTHIREHKRSIELRQFLQRAPQVRICNMGAPGRMPNQRIENQRPGSGEYGIRVAQRE